MSLQFLYDVYSYFGSDIQFDQTNWVVRKNDILVQLHVSQNIHEPNTEDVLRSWVAAKSLFPKIAGVCKKYNGTYVVSATDYDLSRILSHFIPSFEEVDVLDPKGGIASMIQSRIVNSQRTA